MAPRKIIFLVIVAILSVLVIIGVLALANSEKQKKAEKISDLSVWIVWGTTKEYESLFAGFNAVAPEYKNTKIDIRVFPDYENYHDILLSTLAGGKGPDIFMIEWGGDSILESKSIPVPDDLITLDDFEKRFEDIFLPLMESTGKWDTLKRTLKWVPLGYETLGIFYNKSFFPVFPRTWNEIEEMYRKQDGLLFFPTNLWLWPVYTPTATDIIAHFFWKNGVSETKSLKSGGSALSQYRSFATSEVTPPITLDGSPLVSWANTLTAKITEMDSEALSTIDLFMRGKVGMVVGYPSLIREIEKAEKRAWSEAITDIILTERLPQDSLGKDFFNTARYSYLAVSSKTEHPQAAADFLAYLMSEKTMTEIIEIFPHLISPDRKLALTQANIPLSSVFARTRMDAFLTRAGDKVQIFQYGLKSEYEKTFRDYIDRNEKIDINNLLSRIQKSVECKIESIEWNTLSSKCLE
jgi:ABC-type glycerol-3-phosphate transport system substrate-binding protein